MNFNGDNIIETKEELDISPFVVKKEEALNILGYDYDFLIIDDYLDDCY